MKTVAVSEETWRKLKELKEKIKASSFDDVINALIEAWHLTSLREEVSKVDMTVSFHEVREFITTMRSIGGGEKQVKDQ